MEQLSYILKIIFPGCSLVFSWTLGIVVIVCFLFGSSLAVLLLNRREKVVTLITRLLNYFETDGLAPNCEKLCTVCGESQCPRHRPEPSREPWNEVLITDDLDKAVDSVSIGIVDLSFMFSYTFCAYSSSVALSPRSSKAGSTF